MNQAPQKAPDLPLAQILVRYWEHRGQHRKSADAIKHNLRHWSDFWADSMLSEVTRTRQDEFLRHLRAKGLAEGYIQRIFTIGRAAINLALDNGEITEAPPIAYISAESSSEPRVLTQEEATALLGAVESEHGLMYFALAFNTWARMEAILELNRFQCDLKRRLIQLNPPGRPQTKKYRPIVPITDTLLPLLESAPDGLLVHWHGRPIKSVKKLIQDTAKRAKVGPIDSRTIRHTMATWAGERGVPWAEIEFMLGHKIRSTSAHYARWVPRHDGPAALATDAFLAATPLAPPPTEEAAEESAC